MVWFLEFKWHTWSGDLPFSALSTTGKVCKKSTNGDLSRSNALGITHPSFTKTTNNAAWGQLVDSGAALSVRSGLWKMIKESKSVLCSVWANGISRWGSHGHWKNVKDANIEKGWKHLIQVHFNSWWEGQELPKTLYHGPSTFWEWGHTSSIEQASFGQMMGKSQCVVSQVHEVDLRKGKEHGGSVEIFISGISNTVGLSICLWLYFFVVPAKC